jgi:hypothetical protein
MPKIALTTDGNLYARYFIELGQPEAPVDEYLYDMAGSVYLSGSYDTFQAYSVDTAPSNKGFGWDGPWEFVPVYNLGTIADEHFSSNDYITGTEVSASDGGMGWQGAWNVIEGS